MNAILTHPIVLVGFGGAVGSNARYWLGQAMRQQGWTAPFPWHTLLINVAGSMLLALTAMLFRERTGDGFLLLGVGFCGGFTTFSTFSLESVELIRRGRWDLAVLYALASLALGFAGFLAVVLASQSDSDPGN